MAGISSTMWAARLHGRGGPSGHEVEQVPTPQPAAREVLVRVHAAALTRDELDWPTDRLPAIPSSSLPKKRTAPATSTLSTSSWW